MVGILSLTTFLPLVGVAAILVLRALRAGQRSARDRGAARWIALAITLATFALSILLVAQFNPAPAPASSSSRTRPGSPACTTGWASTASRCCSCC